MLYTIWHDLFYKTCNNLIFQQAAVQAQQLAQSRAAQADSPLHIESDNSDDVSNNKRYDDIEDWEIPPKELILKINQQVIFLCSSALAEKWFSMRFYFHPLETYRQWYEYFFYVHSHLPNIKMLDYFPIVFFRFNQWLLEH